MKRNLIKTLAIIALLTIPMSTVVSASTIKDKTNIEAKYEVENIEVENTEVKEVVDEEIENTERNYVPVEAWMGNEGFINYILNITNKSNIESVTYEDLKNIKEINFDEIGLEGAPEIILKFENLEKLTLSADFNIDDNMNTLNRISECKELRWLFLEGTGLKTFPKVVFNIEKLEKLFFHINDLSEILSNVDSLANLKTLSLWQCAITNIPDSLYNMTNLESLNLSGNKIGVVSPKIANLKNLKSLGLEYCGLKSVPDVLKDMNDNLMCSVSYNYLVDIPKTKGNQKIVYIRNFIHYLSGDDEFGYEETGIKLIAKENTININEGENLTRESIDKLLGATHKSNNTDSSLIYVPYEYEILIDEKVLIPLSEVKSLKPGKYSIRIRFEGAPDYNDYAGSQMLTLNILDKTKPADENKNEENNNISDKKQNETTGKEDNSKLQDKDTKLPYTGGVSSMATILFGTTLTGMGSVLLKKEK